MENCTVCDSSYCRGTLLPRNDAAHEKFAQESERVRRSRRVELHHSLVQRFRDGGFQVRLGRVRGARVLLRGRSRLVVCRFKRRFARASIIRVGPSVALASSRSRRRARVVVLAHLRSSSRRRSRRTSRRRLYPSRSGALVDASSRSFATRARARSRTRTSSRARAR